MVSPFFPFSLFVVIFNRYDYVQVCNLDIWKNLFFLRGSIYKLLRNEGFKPIMCHVREVPSNRRSNMFFPQRKSWKNYYFTYEKIVDKIGNYVSFYEEELVNNVSNHHILILVWVMMARRDIRRILVNQGSFCNIM